MRQQTLAACVFISIFINFSLTLLNMYTKGLLDSTKHIVIGKNNFILREIYSEKDEIPIKVTVKTKIHRPNLHHRVGYPIVSFQSYRINNPDICAGRHTISTIVMVYSRPTNFKIREKLRKHMLNSTYYYPESIRVVFLLGSVTNNFTQKAIEIENSANHDIVQGYFKDSYRNLTNKGVMGFKWISEHCMNADFVTKIDSDVFIDFFKVFEKLNVLKRKKKLIYCNRIKKNRMPIIRNPRSKWFVSEDYMKNQKYYPLQYCSGCAVFLSIDLIPMLYDASLSTPFFWVDDYYLFGLLPSRVKGVTYLPLSLYFSWSLPKAIKCYKDRGKKCNYALVYLHSVRSFDSMWDVAVKDRNQSILGNFHMDHGTV